MLNITSKRKMQITVTTITKQLLDWLKLKRLTTPRVGKDEEKLQLDLTHGFW